MNRPDCGDIRPALFAHALSLRSGSETVDEVRVRYLKGSGRDPVMADAGFRGVESGMQAASRSEDLVRWCGSLLHAPLPSRVRAAAYGYAINAAIGAGRVEEFISLVAQAISSLPEELGTGLVESAGDNALGARQEAAVQRLAELLDRGPSAESAYAEIGQSLMVRQAWVFKDLAAAGTEYLERFARLRGRAERLFLELTRAGKGDPEFVSGLSMFVLQNAQPDQRLFVSAARVMLDSSLEIGGPKAALDALARLRAMKLQERQLIVEMERVFFDIMGKASPEEKKTLVDFALSLARESADQENRKKLGLLILDGCALTEDYQRALGLFDEGLLDRNDEAMAMTRYKIQAHIAIKADDFRTAITNLESFLSLLDPKQTYMDPIDGTVIPASYVQALNLARIAELWKKAGDSTLSDRKYGEARLKYESTLSGQDSDPRLRRLVETQMAALPPASPSGTTAPR
jgi:tetratricopeptide (TPR) repeat protein